MSEPKDTVSWQQTVLRQHKELLEFVYMMPIQDVIRSVVAERVVSIPVDKQNEFFEKVNNQ